MIGRSRQGLERELSHIRDLLTDGEPDALRVPPKRVNTSLVTQAYAAKPPLVRAMLREQVFATYWQDGEDLTDPAIVRRLCGDGDDPLVVARGAKSGWRCLGRSSPSWRCLMATSRGALVCSTASRGSARWQA